MKKVLSYSALSMFCIVALSSCRKDYECVSNNGSVYDTCNNCRSRGVVKIAFDSNCAYYGGTVQVK